MSRSTTTSHSRRRACLGQQPPVPMTPFHVLAPDLDRAHTKMLVAMLHHVQLTPANLLDDADVLPDGGPVNQGWVLSVGKAGLDVWHRYGLVQVGAHHGLVFHHQTASGTRLNIMQLQHPGSALQRTLPGMETRAAMVNDLGRFRAVLLGTVDPRVLRMSTCAKCLTMRVKKGTLPPRRKAEYWEDRLDGVGLCEDHWRGRAKIQQVDKKKVERNKSKKAAQIAGQLEMVPDGQRVMVRKKR